MVKKAGKKAQMVEHTFDIIWKMLALVAIAALLIWWIFPKVKEVIAKFVLG
jgi:hypothetical protein